MRLVGSRPTAELWFDQFLAGKIILPDCLTELADALTKIRPEVSRADLPTLTDIVIANNAKVMREAEKRERNRRASHEYYRKSKTKIQRAESLR